MTPLSATACWDRSGANAPLAGVKRQYGFTLLEMLLAISIAVLILGVPGSLLAIAAFLVAASFAPAAEARLASVREALATADEESAASDMVRGLPFGEELDGLLREYRDEATPEAILVHDADLLAVLDGWVASLRPEAFDAVIALLRRTFGAFEAAERALASDPTDVEARYQRACVHALMGDRQAALEGMYGATPDIGAAIRIAVFARREEIFVMRLVGAKDSLIWRPFLLAAPLLAIGLGSTVVRAAVGGLRARFVGESLTRWEAFQLWRGIWASYRSSPRCFRTSP